jgi:hypothetical protein
LSREVRSEGLDDFLDQPSSRLDDIDDLIGIVEIAIAPEILDELRDGYWCFLKCAGAHKTRHFHRRCGAGRGANPFEGSASPPSSMLTLVPPKLSADIRYFAGVLFVVFLLCTANC